MNHNNVRSDRLSFFYIILILMAAFLIRTFGYGLYRVPSESMKNTMLVGELFFANKFCFINNAPQVGDIVAFNDPLYHYSNNKVAKLFQRFAWGPSNWTKRIIGVPGDTIQGVVENDRAIIYRNDVILNEPYVSTHVAGDADEFFITLKEGQYWVMGDNRGNSKDSRYFGPLDRKLIHGKITFRVASLGNRDLWQVVTHPIDFWKSIKWDRCAQRIS